MVQLSIALVVNAGRFIRQRPDDALLAGMVATFPLIGFAPLSIGRVGVKFSWILAMAIIGLASVRIAARGTVRVSIPLGLFAIWVGWALVTGFRPLIHGEWPQIREFAFGVLRLGTYLAMTLAVYNLDLDRDSLRTVFKATLIVGTLVAVFALYQFLARQHGLPFAYLELSNPSLLTDRQTGGTYYTGGVFPRVTSFFPEPSWLGMYLNDVIFITAIPLLFGVDRDLLFDSERLNQALLSLVVVAFLVAYSLGAYASIGVTLIIFLAAAWSEVRNGLTRTVGPPIGSFVAFDLVVAGGMITVVILRRIYGLGSKVFGPIVALVGFELNPSSGGSTPTPQSTTTPDSAGPSVQEVSKSSLAVRTDRIRSGLDVWSENPVTGVGLNNYQFFAEQGEVFVGRTYGWTFNYIKTLAEMGIVGLVLLLGLLGYIIVSLHRTATHKFAASDRVGSAMARSLFAVIVVDAISAMFINQFFMIRVWFYVALATVILAEWDGMSEWTVHLPTNCFPWISSK